MWDFKCYLDSIYFKLCIFHNFKWTPETTATSYILSAAVYFCGKQFKSPVADIQK